MTKEEFNEAKDYIANALEMNLHATLMNTLIYRSELSPAAEFELEIAKPDCGGQTIPYVIYIYTKDDNNHFTDVKEYDFRNLKELKAFLEEEN